jgi:hypothetical protein
MKKGIEVKLGPGERERLEALIGSGKTQQKRVWRTRVVLLSADGVGTMAIQRQTGKGQPTIWRWQKRFVAEGVDGLLHDATRPGRAGRNRCRPRQSQSKFSLHSDAEPLVASLRMWHDYPMRRGSNADWPSDGTGICMRLQGGE